MLHDVPRSVPVLSSSLCTGLKDPAHICTLPGYFGMWTLNSSLKPSRRAQGWSIVPWCYSCNEDTDRNGSVLVYVAISHLSWAYFSPLIY